MIISQKELVVKKKGDEVMNELKKNRHSVYSLNYHLVVVTKYRYKCINQEIMDEIQSILKRLIDESGGSLTEFNGEADHVHLLFEIPPHVSPAKMVNVIKGVSSRLIRKKFGEYLKKYYWKPVFWSNSYCVITTGGASIEIVKKYIESQAGVKD